MQVEYNASRAIAILVTTALLFNAMMPTLAHAATYLQGAEVNANTLIRDAYVQVTYYDSNAEQKLAKGWIDTIGKTSFTIREGGFRDKKTIAYDKVLSVIMSDESTVPAKQMNEVNRFIREMRKREIEQNKKEKEAKEAQTVIMSQGQIDLSKIMKGWYAHVVYTSEGVQETTTGKIIRQDSVHIVIRVQEERALRILKTIAYKDIDTLVIAQHAQSIEAWKNAKQIQRYLENGYNIQVLVQASSIWENRVVGRLVKMTPDTLVISGGGTFFQVPVSSISNFEVNIGQHRNTGKGTDYILIRVEDKALKSWKTIAYRDVDTLVITQHTRDIEGWGNVRQTQGHREQSTQQLSEGEPRVRVYAPSIRKGWMVGKLVKKTQDTLVVRGELTLYGRRFYQVPLSSISYLEVSAGKYRNTFNGMKIGLYISLGVAAILAVSAVTSESEAALILSDVETTSLFLFFVSLPITTVATIIGTLIKSDKWVGVSPDRLNLSVAPTSTKGLRAALTFNF